MGKLSLRTALFRPRALVAFLLVIGSAGLAVLSFAGVRQNQSNATPRSEGGILNSRAAFGSIAPAANSGPGWSSVFSPNTTTQQLAGVRCISETDCWAVGYYYLAYLAYSQTLTEHWDGNSWSIVPSPNANTQGNSTLPNRLTSVACNSAADCWAVGYFQTPSSSATFSTLIEHWDGNSWSIVSSVNPSSSQNQFFGLACASSIDCWAVGSYKASNNATQTFVEHWNGSAWAVTSSPNTSNTVFNRLNAVTSNTSLDCWAVGYAGSTTQTLTEHWDGVAWSIVNSANTSPTAFNRLTSVTCLSTTECWAAGYVGTSNTKTLIERWNGSTWSIVSSPNTSATQDNRITGITCASATQCWAVGFASDTQTWTDLIERWDGSSWSLVTSPTNVPTQFNNLNAITCSSGAQCWAVGNTDFQFILVEIWNGNSWSIASAPSTSGGGQDNSLNGITCSSTTDCWAVGQNANEFSFIEHWDGTKWSIAFVPISSWNNVYTLFRVACAGPNECWAVGYYNDNVSFYDHSLAIHWNGSSWSEVLPPNVPNRHNYLNDVKCTAIGNCWAIGTSIDPNANTTATLIEQWNGTSWSIVTSPNSPPGNPAPENHLEGLSCTSSSNCWAVGFSGDYNAGYFHTLVERWDGNSWAIVSSPDVTQENQFASVTCSSASDCWAVGNSYNPDQTLMEHWDGNSWSTSGTISGDPTLTDVACSSASECWVVGSNDNNPVILQWDGVAWSSVSFPYTGAFEHFYSVACPSAASCWAVGDYQVNSFVNPTTDPPWVVQTLIEVYSATNPPLTNVKSRIAHGSSGTFDLDLPLTGAAAIECRRGGVNGNFSIVFNFANDVTSCGTAATAGGTALAGPNSNQCTLNLTGVPNGQTINVELDNVTDALSNTGNVSVSVGFLVGDTNKDGFVDAVDVAQTKSQSGNAVSQSNFREDVNADGFVDAVDVALVKSKSGTVLSSSPLIAKPALSAPKSKPRKLSRNP